MKKNLSFLHFLPSLCKQNFEYVKKNNRENGTAIVGIELKFSKDLNDLVKKMKENGFFGEYLNEKPETLRFLI